MNDLQCKILSSITNVLLPYLLVVKILDTLQYLFKVETCFWLSEGLSSLVELHQRAASTQLKQDVDMILVFKKIMEINNIRMRQCTVNFNLHSHLQTMRAFYQQQLNSVLQVTYLFSLMRFRKNTFWNNLSSINSVCVNINKFIAMSKPTLHKKEYQM